MNKLYLSSLPSDFSELRISNLEGVEISHSVIDPVLHFFRSSSGIQVSIQGRRFRRGKEERYSALSIIHNWVFDGCRICPLPSDTSNLVASLLGGIDPQNIRYSDFLRLVGEGLVGLDVSVDPDVYRSGKESAIQVSSQSVVVPGLNAALFPYQAQGVRWIVDTVKDLGGAVIADEMGLGKTIQVIASILLLKPTKSKPALIICPTSLIANWVNEITRFAPSLSIKVHRGAERAGIASGLQESDIVITTYGTATIDSLMLQGISWTWLVFDEAQAIKNPESERRNALAGIAASYYLPMTGTLVENSLLDLWSVVDMAIPGLLGNKNKFSDMFPDTEESAEILNNKVSPVVLRRLVADVAKDLPERLDIDVPVYLSKDHSLIYEQIRRDAVEEYGASSGLVATTRLSLFCGHPWLVSNNVISEYDAENAGLKESRISDLSTPKIKVLIGLLREAIKGGRKVLIFANFNRCFDIIVRAASDINVVYWNRINGATPQECRQKIVDEFAAVKGGACLVLNPRAAGAGLNIVAATVVIHYTPVWNPAIESQASARAHRRGQTDPVTVYKLFYKSTVEEVMVERSKWKGELGAAAVPINSREKEDLNSAMTISPVDGDEYG